jgi:hypothetical protein
LQWNFLFQDGKATVWNVKVKGLLTAFLLIHGRGGGEGGLIRIRILLISIINYQFLCDFSHATRFLVDHFWRLHQARRHCRLLQLSQNLLRKPIADQQSHKFTSCIIFLRVNLNFVNMFYLSQWGFSYGSFPDEDMELFLSLEPNLIGSAGPDLGPNK